jgi:signal transduction histidine kinase
LLSAHDVTDIVDVQRQLERTVERLRNANEGLQQFVRIASHDLREPLNTIAQFCALVQTDHSHELSPSGRLYFEHIGGGATRMRGLLDDVLSFARLEAGAAVALQSVAMTGVLHTVVAALGARIAQRQARVELAAPLPTVLGNESLLVLLFQNLVSNGIKFVAAEQAPHVRISGRDDGEHVVITVADNGIGIAADEQGPLFTPFKRLHTRRQYDGTGLGLAICKRIVEALGGTIGLESEVGAGTQLHVRLRRPAPA